MAKQKEESRVTAEECGRIRDFLPFVFIDADVYYANRNKSNIAHFDKKLKVYFDFRR